MQATTIGGIAGGVIGIGAAAAIHLAGRDEPAKAEAKARVEWEAWKSKLDAEFPTRSLTGPGEEARFEAWLADNPAPDFVLVKSDDLRAISIAPWDTSSAKDNMGGALGLAGIGAGLAIGFGGASLAWSSRFPSAVNGLGAAGQFGGAALALGLIGASFFQPKADGLKQEIASSEWSVPTKWTD